MFFPPVFASKILVNARQIRYTVAMTNGLYIDRVLLREPPGEDSYLSAIPAVRWLIENGEWRLSSPVTVLCGENGTGKSTLLEAVAVAYGFNPEGGTLNFTFSTEDSHSGLYRCIRLAKRRRPRNGFFLRAESFYNMATYIDRHDADPESGGPIITGFGGVSLHQQSHGESFLAAVQHRFGGQGLYLLDEPEAALSPQKQMTLLVELKQLADADSQIILSTHSPILMAIPGAEVWELTGEGMRRVDYRATEHFTVYREFLNHPERMLSYLFD